MSASSLHKSVLDLSVLLWLLVVAANVDGLSKAVAASGAASPYTENPSPRPSRGTPFSKGRQGATLGGTGDFAAAAPITEYRTPNTAPAIPLFPRAANPAAEFQAVLDLARGSATRQAVADIEDGNYAAALAKLDALAAGAFHWRGQVSNGYQQGFFLYALRGYCLEALGEVVKAYRSYQNSRACFDDETVDMQCPEPRLEVFLGLGRTCLVAGRYTDAFNWFELARIEAAGLPRLAAAADRGLIRRAIEIGDYHDATTNFWDLQCLLLETGNWKLVADAEATSNIQQSTLNVECAAVEQPSKFVRPERILSRDEHKELAQLYFWTHQDRPGFKTLLDGITLLGIDNDLGVKDPMVDAYLNNIMRADDAEIQRFYDLLGYAINQARSRKGDEDYIAMLVNARNAMSRGFTFLERINDLVAVRKRINAVKTQLAALSHGMPRPASARGTNAQRASLLAQRIKMDADNTAWFTADEDALMSADILWASGSRAQAAVLYSSLCTNGRQTNHAAFFYDGTTMLRASRLGWLQATGLVSTNADETWDEVYQPSSLREWSYCLWAESQRMNNASNPVEQSWIFGSDAVPRAYPPLLSYITRAAACQRRHQQPAAFVRILSERWQRRAAMDAEFHCLWFAACAALGRCSDAYLTLQRALCYLPEPLARVTLLVACVAAIPWASDEDLEVFARCAYAALVEPMLDNPATGFHALRNIFVPAQELCAAERDLRTCQAAGDIRGVLHAFSNVLIHTEHAGTLARVAQCLAKAGQPGAAFAYMWRSYHLRSSYATPFGGDALNYPVLETKALEIWFASASQEEQKAYMRWLADRMRLARERGYSATVQAMSRSFLFEHALQYSSITNSTWRKR